MQLGWPERNRAVGFADVLGLIGIAGLLIARFVPVAKLPFWGCALRMSTGWPCPGCGLTRAAEGVAQGRFLAAWLANPLGMASALVLAALGIWSVMHLALRVPFPTVRLSSREALGVRMLLALLVVLNYAFLLVQARPWGHDAW